MSAVLTPGQIEALTKWDTCTVANAIEGFHVRLRNEGFTQGGLRCLLPQSSPMVGYAVTARMKSSNPPPGEGNVYTDRTDWWEYLCSVPGPRIVILEDVDEVRCASSFAGAMHAHVWQALGCVGIVTNGAVRDLPAIEKTGLHLYAESLVPSHGFAHIVDFGKPVTIAGLEISSGDLLHGDQHGIVQVPLDLAPGIPEACGRIAEREARLRELCRSSDFTIEKLRREVKQHS